MLTLVKSPSGPTSHQSATKKSPAKKRSPAIEITPPVNRQVVEVLEGLLDKAKSGQLSGMMYVIRLESKDHGVGVCGSYLADLHSGLAAFCLVYGLLAEQIRLTTQRAEE